MTTNHEAAQSAIYHIESMERKLKLLKQYINPQAGVVVDEDIVKNLVNGVDEEITDLSLDVERILWS